MPTTTTPLTNQLISALPDEDRLRFLAACESVDLAFADILAEPGAPILHVYFPTESFISLVTPQPGSPNLEVGMIGDEGMLGITLILGISISPLHAVVQGGGPVLRIGIAAFRQQLDLSPTLQRILKRYLFILIEQLALSVACSHFHVAEARLARWLLMTQDRAHVPHFHLTHKFLACMLGVRRVGVTKAATALQDKKLISYRRGEITIVDRSGLEQASCACYNTAKASHTAGMQMDIHDASGLVERNP
jgi:CRP-like cAMP-binding protein